LSHDVVDMSSRPPQRAHSRSFAVGDEVSRTVPVTDELVQQFSRLTGDDNPLHLDAVYAARTRFGRQIAHGMIAATQIGTLIGTQLPGPGAIYLSQHLTFLAPVYLGDVVTATVRVKGIRLSTHRPSEPILTLETGCTARGVKVLEGEAVVLYEPV
jgi:3-hydroxybutyryl-CoA dehydratase